MTKIVLTFEGDDWTEVLTQVRAMLTDSLPTSMAMEADYHDEDPGEATAEEKEIARDLVAHAPAAAAAAAPKRSHKAKGNSGKAPDPANTPTQAPPTPPVEPEPKPSAIPALETLKQTITVAVRAAQKNEGPKQILELLPEFKKATGLDFVMNAQEQHREALFDLIQAAGLEALA